MSLVDIKHLEVLNEITKTTLADNIPFEKEHVIIIKNLLQSDMLADFSKAHPEFADSIDECLCLSVEYCDMYEMVSDEYVSEGTKILKELAKTKEELEDVKKQNELLTAMLVKHKIF